MKRSPMPARKEPMRRSRIVTPPPDKPWAVFAKKTGPKRKRNDPWVVTRRIIFERDGGRCRICLRPAHHCHHVLPRSRGGKNDGSTPLLLLCLECHNYVHAHPKESKEKGWLI